MGDEAPCEPGDVSGWHRLLPPPSHPHLGVWGWTGGCCPSSPAPPALPRSSKRGEIPSANPAMGGRDEPPALLGDPPIWGALESPLCDPPAHRHVSGHPSARKTHGTLWGTQLEGTVGQPPPPQPLTGDPAVAATPGLTKGSCHVFRRHFPQTNVTSVYRTAVALKCHQAPASTPIPKARYCPWQKGGQGASRLSGASGEFLKPF